MEERVTVVCGRRIEQIGGAILRGLVRQYDGVVVDLGTAALAAGPLRRDARRIQ
jgi:hypothetical protein